MAAQQQVFISTAFGKKMPVQVLDTEGGIARIQFPDGGWAFVKTTSLTTEAPAPEPQASTVDLSALPEGSIYVAVGQPLQFFKIDHVADGKWAGWIFVKRQAGDNFDRFGSQRPGSTYRGAAADLLAQVVEDTPAAMQAYGREIGRCGNCNRTLTDEQSRQRGIGPDCWAQLESVDYWMKASDRAAVAATLAEQERFNEEWAAGKAAFAEHEREQERQAFLSDPDFRS